MTRRFPRLLVASATALLACSGTRGDVRAGSTAFRPVAVGAPVPAYAARLLDGDSLRVGPGAGGSLTLLNVWATWCVPCRHEFPALERLHKTFGSRGLRVVGVSIDASGGDARVRAAARDLGGSFPLARDADGTIQDVFRTIGVPESWLIAPDGILLWRQVGDLTPQVAPLERLITAQLGGVHP